MSFGKEYIVEIPKLKLGRNEQDFQISRPFFEYFEYGPVREGDLRVEGVFQKFTTHIDARFHIHGEVTLNCDRCTEPYPHPLDFEQRIVFTFEPVSDLDHDDIVHISREDIEIDLKQDFYDFIMLQIPLRKVPDYSVHKCPPEVLKLIGEGEEEEENKEADPRWSGLEQLKNKFKDKD